jgi:hypothetical protein
MITPAFGTIMKNQKKIKNIGRFFSSQENSPMDMENILLFEVIDPRRSFVIGSSIDVEILYGPATEEGLSMLC